MDYLNNIQCKKEPFADRQGADIFLSQHFRESFEKLTHSIRLGAGLHTVLGENGTGKSTLIKLLRQKFASDNNISIIHIHNPQFSGLDKFLTTLAGIFKGYKPAPDASDNKLQEEFNSFFHKHCLAKKKSILLLIDEGQLIPDFCLQALDNFYEFHPDCRRFLQTIICGQPPLQKKIKPIKNLHSRAAFTITLKKFSFRETKEMILFHLEQAAMDGQPPPALFSLPAQWAIYRLCQGAPKDILDLCHLVTLTLVIENRKKADWFMVLRCANLLIPGRAKKLQVIRVGSLSSLVAAMLIFGLWSEDIKTFIEPPARQLRKPAVARKVTVPKVKPAKKVQVPVEQEVKQPPEIAKPVAPPEEQVAVVTPPEPVSVSPGKTLQVPGKIPAGQEPPPPASITFVTPQPIPAEEVIEEVEPVATVAPVIKDRRLVKSGDTLLVMIQQVYGEGHLKAHFISQVIETNPHLKNSHSLSIGDEIFFPELIQEPAIPRPPVQMAAKGESLVSKKLHRKLDPADSPGLLGSLTVMLGDTLGKLIRGIYGPFSFNPAYTKKVLAVNQQLKNPDSLEVGETIFFPDLPITPEIGLPAKPGTVASRGELPEFLGEITTIEEETFGDMIRRLYGPYSFNQENLNRVLAVNPQIDNPDFISIGQKLRFPTILVSLTDRAPEVWWVKLVTLGDLQNAYRFLRVYSEWAPPMLIIPSRSEAGKIRYNIVLQEYYVDRAKAEAKISSLPASVTVDAKPIHGLDSKTYYYWTKQGG